MTRAFIVHVELDQGDPATLAGVADDIHDACEGSNIAVVKVVPWAVPGTATQVPPVEAFTEPAPQSPTDLA